MRLAVVLFNLGGPASLDAVQPFLQNLFSDPAILPFPGLVRRPLARLIAARRTPVAREIYAKLGGSSPILEQTRAQARALQDALTTAETDARAFVAMRASPPTSDDAVRDVAQWKPDRIVLLPLYPQFSTTTSASSLEAWHRAAAGCGLAVPTARVCCYPWGEGFVAAEAELVRAALARRKDDVSYRVLFSAHGLPRYVVARGDPYAWQVTRCVEAIVKAVGGEGLDWRISYQSRVGPLKWLEPATDAEIRSAGADGKGVIVVPVAFVSEHSETLVELDMDYAHLARDAGVRDYIRVPTVGTSASFVDGLARLVRAAAQGGKTVTCGAGRICPAALAGCGFDGEAA